MGRENGWEWGARFWVAVADDGDPQHEAQLELLWRIKPHHKRVRTTLTYIGARTWRPCPPSRVDVPIPGLWHMQGTSPLKRSAAELLSQIGKGCQVQCNKCSRLHWSLFACRWTAHASIRLLSISNLCMPSGVFACAYMHINRDVLLMQKFQRESHASQGLFCSLSIALTVSVSLCFKAQKRVVAHSQAIIPTDLHAHWSQLEPRSGADNDFSEVDETIAFLSEDCDLRECRVRVC